MRLSPVPLFYRKNPVLAIEQAAESSKTTHGTKTCLDACRFLSALIIGALSGEGKEKLLSPRYCSEKNYWETNPLIKEIDEIACGSYKTKNPPDIVGSGYVVKSLEAALWAFYNSESFKKGCLLAVNLGDDADTTGAVYGQLAGAFYGEENIPLEWREKVAKKNIIISLAEKLYTSSS